MAAPATDPIQRSLEELGTPLADVPFCVVDLETTGLSPSEYSITEIGAVRSSAASASAPFSRWLTPGLQYHPP